MFYCVAMRGRYDESGKISQHLEPRHDGLTNTLTTVQKDNCIIEYQEYDPFNICINDRGFVNKCPQITYGYAPTLRAESHGNLPKVIVND